MTADRTRRRLQRLLRDDLGAAVTTTDWGTWTTTSSLPHEIRLETDTGVEFVRVSAAAVLGVRETRALLAALNALNVRRVLTKWIWGAGTVLVVAEQPVASLRPGDIENLVSGVLCCARLDGYQLASHGGQVTSGRVPDVVGELSSWSDLLQASGTATERELAVWIDQLTGSDCWIDNDSHPEDGPIVVIGDRGLPLSWPLNLMSLLADTEYLMGVLEEEALEESAELC